MADSRTRSAGSRNFTQVTSMYHPWKVTMKAHLQLWKQAGQELALGGLPHALRRQQELHKGLAVRGGEGVQPKVRVLCQLLPHLLVGALVAKEPPAWHV